MEFSLWWPLGEALAHADDNPGVVQTRGDQVRPYPRGKSAMVMYTATREDETLRDFVVGTGAAELARAAAAGACWVRFGPTRAPERELARLLANFEERFGARPGNGAR